MAEGLTSIRRPEGHTDPGRDSGRHDLLLVNRMLEKPSEPDLTKTHIVQVLETRQPHHIMGQDIGHVDIAPLLADLEA